MHMNPAYEPDYDGRVPRERRGMRDGYRSDDDRYRDKGRSPRRDERRHESDDERDRGKRNQGYSSEPDRRRDNRDESRGDDRRYFRDDDRHDPDYYYYGRDHSPRPYYNPRDQPYFYPSRDMFHPMFMPERDPRFQPYYRYEGDMRRQPFYMYDPMDVYNPRYRGGPDDYFMGPPHQPRPYYKQAPRRKRSSGKSKKNKQTHVEFDDEVEERDFDPNEIDPYIVEEVERSKLRARLGLLIFLIILLVACVAIGAVATAMEPWWLEETTSGGTTFQTIRVGLWRTCYRPDTKTAWVCQKYSDTGYESPYQSITLLQWSMIVGCISAFISLTLAVIAIFGRRSRFLMGIIYTTIFFAIGATVLFGLVIAYVNEDAKTTKIVAAWTKVTDANLKTGTMFALGCAAVATSGMALIICCVFAFIYEPEIQTVVEPPEDIVEEEEVEEEEEKVVKVKKVKPKTTLIEKEEIKKRPKRQGTKYVKRDEKDGKAAQMNGQVNRVHHKEPAVITKDKESSANAKQVRQPKLREEPRQNGVNHVMLPRQNYPAKDYGSPKKKKPASEKQQKQVQGGQPIRSPQKTNVINKNITPPPPPPPPPPPLPQQSKKGRPPNAVKLPIAAQKPKKIPMYDGDYDKYFDTPY